MKELPINCLSKLALVSIDLPTGLQFVSLYGVLGSFMYKELGL